MPLSKVALYCLESSSYLKQEILNTRDGVQIQKHRKYGEFYDLYEKYRNDPEQFYDYTSLSIETFDYILAHITGYMERNTRSNGIVSTPEKLFLTLRYLGHGISFISLSRLYRLSRGTVTKTVYQTLKAIWCTLRQFYMPQPTQRDFEKISEDFFFKCQFPNCIGSIGEINLRATKSSATDSERHTKHFSIILQAISDANYNFIAVEIGEKIKHTDIFNKLVTNNRINVQPPQKLPGSNVTLPPVLAGGETYPLKTYLMRPYPSLKLNAEKEIFNQRLAKARVIIECTFGIFLNKWLIFNKSIETLTKHAKLILKVACLLHNIIRQRDGNEDKHFKEFMNRSVTNKKKIKKSRRNNHSSVRAVAIRDRYRNYFVNNPIN